MKFNAPFSLFALVCLSVAGCDTTTSGRAQTASEAALSSNMTRVQYATPPFVLAGWQKNMKVGAPIHVYIEGDGRAWLSRSEPSLNPTPVNPVALKLAGLDPSPNVLYLARPCQYTPIDMPGNEGCRDSSYWRGKRFSEEVIASYMTALDQVAAQSNGATFELTGYSGGANIAGLLAARRGDVTLLRTVAGNVDNDYFTDFHEVSAMPLSLNMASDAARLANTPQIHLIGAEDETVPEEIYQSYARKSASPFCLQHKVLPGVTHEDGWEKQWPSLLTLPAFCQ